ncbi:MAG: glycoside hydrolase family 25 protein [Coprobacillaceae bacterium]
MKKKRQKQIFIAYCLIVLVISALSIYTLSQLHKFSVLTVFLSVSVFSFLILFFLFLSSKDIKYQKPQWFLVIILLIGSIYGLQSSPDVHFDETKEEYTGIDISKWNGSVNLEKVVLEIDFIIIRCGYTSNVDVTTQKIDNEFETNLKQCIDLGIPYGVYYYSLAATPEAAKSDAEYTLDLLDGNIPPLGVYIDVEDEMYQGHLSKEELTDITISFVDTIEETKNKGGIYANYYWWTEKLDHDTLSPYLKWLALYSETYEMEDIYHMHQYTDKGTLKGITGDFDVNIVKEKFW